MERKTKLKHEKEENLKRVRDQHIKELKTDLEARTKALEKKIKNGRVKRHSKKGSLPLISGSKANSKMLLNMPGEEWRLPRLN
jgi:hypothetical protein